MKRILCLIIALLAWSNARPVTAQEPLENELELIRQLRIKGWNDLAKTKVEELMKRGDPVLNAALPLELAEIAIASARKLDDPELRLAGFEVARVQLRAFIANNQGKATAALAQVKLARLTTYNGQALLSKAMRDEDPKARYDKARPAETAFIQAGTELEQAIKAIQSALPDADAKLKAILEQELKQARFDIAINLFDQAKTYVGSDNLALRSKRAEVMGKTIDAFKALRNDESTQIGWLANAWLVKCAMETTAPDDAILYYTKIMARKDDKNVQPAIRLVRYFHMQDMTMHRPEDAEVYGDNAIASKSKVKKTPLDRIHDVQKEGVAWLKDYPNDHKTYEGQGVRYELAYAYLAEANELLSKKDEKGAAALFKLASDQFKILGDYDGDLSDRARTAHMRIEFKSVASGKIELHDFNQFYLKAMIERESVIAVSRKLDDPKLDDKKGLEKERKAHLKEVIHALSKALALAETNRTPPKKVDDARYYLSGAYLAYGDPYRAAIIAELLGRSRSSSRSAEGASTALATYAALQGRHPDDAGIRQRLYDMADFVLAVDAWKSDSVSSLAHYHVGMAAKREGKSEKAIMHLARIDKNFMDYNYTQGQAAFIAEDARQKSGDRMYLIETKAGDFISGVYLSTTKTEILIEDDKSKAQAYKLADIKVHMKQKDWHLAAAKAAIGRMKPINPKEDSPSVLTMYFFAKLEMSKYMYSEAMEELKDNQPLKAINKCKAMEAYVRDLRVQFDQLPGKTLSPENREQLDFTMAIMLKYADLGVAETRFRGDTADRFDKVIEATKNVVDGTLAKAKALPVGEPIKLKDYRVTGDILGLALRANVQKGDVKRGKEILDALQRLSGLRDNEKAGNVVGLLLNDISGQIKRMKTEKDPNLAKTKDNYTAFLDVIAKEYESKGFDDKAAILLAHAFTSLDYPSKAAAMYVKIKAPASLDKDVPKKTAKLTDKERDELNAWEEEINRYWGIRIEYIRALRGSKDAESLTTATATINDLLKHKNARYQLFANMEKYHILEDQKEYRKSTAGWGNLMKPLQTQLAKPEVQKIYFPAYFYQTRTLFKTAVHDKDIKDRPKLITIAAQQVIKLEYSKSREGWNLVGPMFIEMLKDKEFEQLKTEYDKLKAAQPKSGSSNRPLLKPGDDRLARAVAAPPCDVWRDALSPVGAAANSQGHKPLDLGSHPRPSPAEATVIARSSRTFAPSGLSDPADPPPGAFAPGY